MIITMLSHLSGLSWGTDLFIYFKIFIISFQDIVPYVQGFFLLPCGEHIYKNKLKSVKWYADVLQHPKIVTHRLA